MQRCCALTSYPAPVAGGRNLSCTGHAHLLDREPPYQLRYCNSITASSLRRQTIQSFIQPRACSSSGSGYPSLHPGRNTLWSHPSWRPLHGPSNNSVQNHKTEIFFHTTPFHLTCHQPLKRAHGLNEKKSLSQQDSGKRHITCRYRCRQAPISHDHTIITFFSDDISAPPRLSVRQKTHLFHQLPRMNEQ